MDTIKDRNDKDLTEVEEIKRRWQEYTEISTQKGLHDPDNQHGVVTQHDIPECEVKWVFGSIKVALSVCSFGSYKQGQWR